MKNLICHQSQSNIIQDKKYDLWWNQFANKIPFVYYHDKNLKHLFLTMFDPSPQARITVSGIEKNTWYKNKRKKCNQNIFSQMWKVYVRSQILMQAVSTKQAFKNHC